MNNGFSAFKSVPVIKWAKTVVWALVVCFLSLAPIRDTGDVTFVFPGSDKVIHFAMYFLFAKFLAEA